MKVIKFNKKYYKQVNKIYKESFPKEERYISLNKMIKNKDTELYCLINKEEVYGIIYLIKYKEMIFILYLAINPEIRSEGYGSYLLKWCLNKYNEKDIYLNIDEIKENKKDYETRKKREKFYLKNGFYMTDYISKENTQNFNILCNHKIIKIEDYMELDKFVAQILDEPVSNIIKKTSNNLLYRNVHHN